MPRHLNTNMKVLIDFFSAHHIKKFHFRLNLSSCKKLKFNIRLNFIKYLNQELLYYFSDLIINISHLHIKLLFVLKSHFNKR